MITKILALSWLLGVGPLLAESISATVTMGQSFCHVARFPGGWSVPREIKAAGWDHFGLDFGKLEFRATEADTQDFLVGVYQTYRNAPRPEDYSPNKFWVDMRHGGRARAATEQEWNAGFRLGALSKAYSEMSFAPDPPKDTEDLVFKGRSFKKSGTLWVTAFNLTRVSQDGQWLMVHSMDGTRREKRGGGNGDMWVLRDDIFIPHHGTFFLDIYRFATAQKVIAIRASIRGDVYSPGDVAVWLQSRYFVAPIQAHYKELLVCDKKDLSPEEKKLHD